jgi:hypothetical protein
MFTQLLAGWIVMVPCTARTRRQRYVAYVPTIPRGGDMTAPVHHETYSDAERLRRALLRAVPSAAIVVPEADGWSALLPGLPIAG